MRTRILALAAIAALAGCGGSPGSVGPDEFSIVPNQPLVIPSTNALPPPRPNGTNPADPAPRSIAARAMGG
ncbi:DUF3035 domain-containing protein [Salipiger sp. IMCC34102]|uniref:DUF3035 domain-containing protein n=1 Tax=Salipiger sp. IMCC34102 TaxID=2510647 RepID=UPI00101C0F42|nr:DUF3035 domain-containing protein [Salipiger sp. IMCC34102]RYH03924.1 DUF3035 domain-containing protein [Salipiger sp. IMCC34102]